MMTSGGRGRGIVAAIGAAAALLLAPAASRAWLPDGHMATGALAYDALERRDPQAVATVVRLMQSHPDRARFDAQLGDLTGAARDRRLFELMARWPDDARRGPLDHDDWHYAQKVVSGMRFVLPPAFGGAEHAFHRQLAIARDARANPADRAVALCWVMHIVGDMHQPLHAALWMDRRFPLTDEGGNRAWVKTTPEAQPQKLHWFWDSAAGQARLGRGSPIELEAQLETLHPDMGEAATEAEFPTWVAKSRSIAFDAVYQNGDLRPGRTPETATVLSPAYVERARTITLNRLASAGYRSGALMVGLR